MLTPFKVTQFNLPAAKSRCTDFYLFVCVRPVQFYYREKMWFIRQYASFFIVSRYSIKKSIELSVSNFTPISFY